MAAKEKTTKELLTQILKDNKLLKKELMEVKNSIPPSENSQIDNLTFVEEEIDELKSIVDKKSYTNLKLRESLKERDDELSQLKEDISNQRHSKLTIKQENIAMQNEIKRLHIELSKHKNKLHELSHENSNLKLMGKSSYDQSILELKQKDSKILEQGQEMISLRNTIQEKSLNESRLHKMLESSKASLDSYSRKVSVLNTMIGTIKVENDSKLNSINQELNSYKKIVEDLKINNVRLVEDVQRYDEQVKLARSKLKQAELSSLKEKESASLEKKSKDEITLELYGLNKEVEILKQTILELTHKLKLRKVDETKVISDKNQEFDKKMRELTESHGKKALELEYKIQELKEENQALKFDNNQLKEKQKQLLERVTAQFNDLI